MASRAPRIDGESPRPALVAGGLAAVLVLAGLGIGGFFILRPVQEPTTAARVAADTFVSRLRAGDASGAYDQLCHDARDQIEREQFVARIGARPAVRGYRIDAVDPVDDEGFTVRVTLTDPSGTDQEQVLRIVQDRGSWRVCGDPAQLTGEV